MDTGDFRAWLGPLAESLKVKGITVATAESCTGGLIAATLTEVAGASSWFRAGLITYTVESKIALLGVPKSVIETEGVVSEAVAIAMAKGAVVRTDAQLSVSVTGIAGPTGAEPGKPIGTVCMGIAWATPGGIQAQARTFIFSGDRHAVRQQTVKAAIQMLLSKLENLF